MESNLLQPIADITGLPVQTLFVFLSLGIIGLVAGAVMLRNKNNVLDLETGTTRVRVPRDRVVVVGPVGSGKTQLFYRMLSTVEPSTVSSTEINQSDGEVELRLPKSLGREEALRLSFVDIPGHFNFRMKV